MPMGMKEGKYKNRDFITNYHSNMIEIGVTLNLTKKIL